MIGLAMVLATATDKGIYDWCKASEMSLAGLSCTAFVDGAISGALALAEYQNSPPPFCIPKEARQRERALTVVAYVDRHPDYRDRDSGGIVIAAMHDAFPCAAAMPHT